jgi:flagellin-like hook-associated protein FlgL
LTAEVDNIAASTASLAEAATVFNTISLASGYKSAGYSASADSAGVDFAAETARLAAAQIKAQAANAMVAQAGVVKQTDLALLQ